MRPHAPAQGENPTPQRAKYLSVLGSLLLLAGIVNCFVGANALQDFVAQRFNCGLSGTSGIGAQDLI
jgi:hypothetical protein